MSRLLLVGVVAAAVFGAVVTDALAQRSAGAKARGEFGRGFWNQGPVYGQYYAGPTYYQPTPAAEGYRSFSYRPVPFEAGETVVVSPGAARVMVGREQVGTLQEGQEFEVIRVVNGWLGAMVEQDGQEIRGWVWQGNVVPQSTAAPAPPPAPAAREAAPTQNYRSFSYEPGGIPAMTIPAQPRRRAVSPTPPEVRLRPGIRRY